MSDRRIWGLLLLVYGRLAMASNHGRVPLEWNRLWLLALGAVGLSLRLHRERCATPAYRSALAVAIIASFALPMMPSARLSG